MIHLALRHGGGRQGRAGQREARVHDGRFAGAAQGELPAGDGVGTDGNCLPRHQTRF